MSIRSVTKIVALLFGAIFAFQAMAWLSENCSIQSNHVQTICSHEMMRAYDLFTDVILRIREKELYYAGVNPKIIRIATSCCNQRRNVIKSIKDQTSAFSELTNNALEYECWLDKFAQRYVSENSYANSCEILRCMCADDLDWLKGIEIKVDCATASQIETIAMNAMAKNGINTNLFRLAQISFGSKRDAINVNENVVRVFCKGSGKNEMKPFMIEWSATFRAKMPEAASYFHKDCPSISIPVVGFED